MKTLKQQFLSLSIAALLLITTFSAFAQEPTPAASTPNVIKIEKPFDAIDVSGMFRVFLVQGDEQMVQAESPETINMTKLVNINDNVMSFSMSGIQKPDKLKIYVTFKTLNSLWTSGASNVKGLAPIKAEHFKLDASGASKVELDINCSNLVTEASGAAEVKFSGKTDLLSLEATGASNVKALEMAVAKASVEVSGAANVRLDVKDEISGEASGAAKLTLKQKPASYNIEPSGVAKIFIGENLLEKKQDPDESQTIQINDSQTITIDENGVVIKSDSGRSEPLIINDDGVKIVINEKNVDGKTHKKVLVINDDGVKVVDKESGEGKDFLGRKKNKFNGHWGGFEMGFNGFLDKDNNNSIPKGYEYLDLKVEKSINVKLNLFEQNFNLIRNHVGLTTGLGLEWANYRFKNNVVLVQDSFNLYGFYGSDATKSYEKSKLVVNYLNLPLILEYQTNGKDKTNSFHVAVGMILGWRIGAHSKNIISGSKIKQRDDFSMQPFKYDLTARIGWGILNLNATYAMNTLFKEGRGPELYPFSLGLTLANF